MSHPEGLFTEKNGLAITTVWMHENHIFLVPVKHTLVCCTTQHIDFTWTHDTLSRVLMLRTSLHSEICN